MFLEIFILQHRDMQYLMNVDKTNLSHCFFTMTWRLNYQQKYVLYMPYCNPLLPCSYSNIASYDRPWTVQRYDRHWLSWVCADFNWLQALYYTGMFVSCCRIEDNVHCNLSFDNLYCRPGEVLRKFIHVPRGATWAGLFSFSYLFLEMYLYFC